MFLSGPVGAMNVAASFLSMGGDVIIRMRGLPYTATAKDIVSCFLKFMLPIKPNIS